MQLQQGDEQPAEEASAYLSGHDMRPTIVRATADDGPASTLILARSGSDRRNQSRRVGLPSRGQGGG